jgi:hypothetical protein
MPSLPSNISSQADSKLHAPLGNSKTAGSRLPLPSVVPSNVDIQVLGLGSAYPQDEINKWDFAEHVSCLIYLYSLPYLY